MNEVTAQVDDHRPSLRAPERAKDRAADTELLGELGDRIDDLVERYRGTRRQVTELREALLERDRRIVELDAKLGSLERARLELCNRLDRAIATLDGLSEAVDGERG